MAFELNLPAPSQRLLDGAQHRAHCNTQKKRKYVHSQGQRALGVRWKHVGSNAIGCVLHSTAKNASKHATDHKGRKIFG